MSENLVHLAELHRLCDVDYAKGQQERAAALHTPESSDLAVAIRVGQRMLTAYGDSSRDGFSYPEAYGAQREALRLLLRAHGAEPVDEDEDARRFVARHFPEVTAFLADERGERP
ncbi:hypothetical protein [Streptomyces sp. B21-083]|uniref:hypothetical protein n=1 Tax=Streptomyces sp. B21-083 TaxID=3039410 RepID=UPI002FF273F5